MGASWVGESPVRNLAFRSNHIKCAKRARQSLARKTAIRLAICLDTEARRSSNCPRLTGGTMKKSVPSFKPLIGVFVFLFLPGLFVFFSCASGNSKGTAKKPNPEEQLRRFFDTSSKGEGLIFHGVSAPRSNKKEALKLALEDAARKVAFYHWVEGSVVQRDRGGKSFFDYAADSEIELSYNHDYKAYVKDLSYDPETDVLYDSKAVYVRVRYSSGSLPLKYSPGSARSRPSWVTSPPSEMSGFPATVGYANPRLYHRDTMISSYENAVIALVRGASQTITSQRTYSDKTGGTFNHTSIRDSTLTARGRLTGFYVVDTWVDPANLAVWTLAVARAVQAR